MNFDLTDEQRALRASVAKMLAAEYPTDRRLAALRLPAGVRPPLWAHLAELGLFALPLPVEDGGYGGSGFDLLAVLQEFGGALVVAPWLPAMLGAQAVAETGSAGQRHALLPAIIEGREVVCWAGRSHDPADADGPPTTTAERAADGWRLTGSQHGVAHGALADRLVVGAQLPGADGSALFVVDARSAGLSRRPHRLLDGSFAADVQLAATPATLLDGLPAAAHERVEQNLEQRGIAALCAEALGVVEAAFALTVDYLGTRRQFGAPLSANQALQHRVADLYVAVELVRSMALQAADAIDRPEPADRRHRLAQAKFVIGRQGRWITQQAIQLHGAIGMTDECAVGHHYRRMLVIDHSFGDAERQLDVLAGALPARHAPVLTRNNGSPIISQGTRHTAGAADSRRPL